MKGFRLLAAAGLLMLACLPPHVSEDRIYIAKHPEYEPPKTPRGMDSAVGLKFTGIDPRRYMFDDGTQLIAYADSLPRCPYEPIRTLKALGDSQRDAVEKLQLALQDVAGDAVIRYVAKDTTWVFFRPSTMTEPQVKKRYTQYVCRGTAIRFADAECRQ